MPQEKPLILDGIKIREFNAATDNLPAGASGAKEFVESKTVEISSTATPEAILTLTTSDIPAGKYKIDWSGIWQTSNSNREVVLSIEVDSVEIWSVLMSSDNSSLLESVASQRVEILDEGVHIIEMIYANLDGNGTVTLRDRTLTLERWE